jgi:uncharacterized RDD family membrane protein YckC
MGRLCEDDRMSATDARDVGVPPPGFAEPTFGQRLAARLIDGLVLLPVILLLAALTDGVTRRALGLTVVAIYEVTLVVRRGQTVGKMAVGTRIVDFGSGSLPSLQQSVVRWLVIIAGSVAALVVPASEAFDAAYTVMVLILVLRPPLHRGLHDLVAGTIVSSAR